VAAGVSAAGGTRPGRLTLEACGDVLSLAEVCAVLGISTKTWQRWRRDHDTPIAELQPATYRPRYAKADVERYLRNPRKPMTPYQRRLAGAA
jgi:predicted site-specific integrase-resolvase